MAIYANYLSVFQRYEIEFDENSSVFSRVVSV